MNYREIIEKREKETLSPFACCSADSAGRLKPETESDIRTVFCRDRDRIIHSKAFRRLKHKTQVFLSPTGDHYRTRLTHTLEVSQISRTIARCLGLNEDLTEAIALGHDLGHTPFGHAGERVLNEICPFRFFHNEQSLRVCTDLEKEGEGLNLTREVLDGILCHTGDKKADTLEGQLVRLSDKIAYINHDIDDAVRAGLLKESDLPQRAVELLGTGHSNRINAMVMGTIEGSLNKPYIEMTDAAGEGGAWGMALLAAYMKTKGDRSLGKWLSEAVFAKADVYTLSASDEGACGYDGFIKQYKAGLSAYDGLREV